MILSPGTIKKGSFFLFKILMILCFVGQSALMAETLDSLLEKTIKNNSSLKAFQNRWEANVALFPASGSLPDPKMSLGLFLENVETRVGPQEWKASLSQTFPSGKKRSLKRNIAEQRAAITYGEYLLQANNVSEKLENLLWEYDYLRHAIQIGESSVGLIENLRQVATTSYKSGNVTQTDIIDITIAMDRATYRYERLLKQRAPLSTRIRELVNASIVQPMNWIEMPEPIKTIETEELLFQEALENNPILTKNRSEKSKTQLDSKLASVDREAEFTFGIEYISTGDAFMSGVSDSGKDPLIAKAGWNLPLRKKRIRSLEQEKRLLLQSRINEGMEIENRIKSEISAVVFQFEDTLRREELYKRSLIPAAKQALEVSRNAFITGKQTFRDVTENEERYLEFRLAQLRAFADRGIALSKLKRLTGRFVTGNRLFDKLETGE